MYGTIFPTFAKCRSHACGFTRVQSYTDQDMSSLSDPVLAYTSLLLLFRTFQHLKSTSKYRKITVITTTEQYFSSLPEKNPYSSMSLLPITIIFSVCC